MQKSNQRIKTFIGFSIKSRQAVFGVDNITTLKKPPCIVLYDLSLSENSKKKLDKYLLATGTDAYPILLTEMLAERNCKAIGIIGDSLAEAVKKEIKERGEYE